MFHEILHYDLSRKSLFLFGARQTGKSTLLRTTFPDAVYYDLLEADTFRELSAAPELIRKRLRPAGQLIIIDEIQKLPGMLDEAHLLDVGVANTLLKRSDPFPGTEMYGRALEHLIFLELKAYLDYQGIDLPLTYWRSLSQLEVAFVLGDSIAIEVKSRSRPTSRDKRGLKALAEEPPLRRKIVVCSADQPYGENDGTEIMPVENFLRALWNNELVAE